MYHEGGWPCGETPPALASSIQDMLLFTRRASADQMPRSVIEVFPGVDDSPAAGPGNVSFHRLRAQGAVLVSASRIDGKTRFVRLEALVDQIQSPCRVKTSLPPPLELTPALPFTTEADGIIAIRMSKGQVVVITSKAQPKYEWTIRADSGVASQFNFWGLVTDR